MNCLIIDDEPLARIGMERLIRQYSHLNVVGTFKNTVGIADFLKKNEVHLLFGYRNAWGQWLGVCQNLT